MSAVLLTVTAMGVAWLGLALLALTQARHWRKTAGAAVMSSSRVRWIRLASGLLLLVSLLITWNVQGGAVGGLLWPLLVGLAGFAQAFILAWRSDWLRGLARSMACPPDGSSGKPNR